MSVVFAGAAAVAKALPWQAWAIVALLLAVGLYGCSQRDAGEQAARQQIQQSNQAARDKADEATRDVENCRGSWDRDRGLCLPDGAGR